MAEASQKSIAELEGDLGLSSGLIRKWMQRYRIDRNESELQLSENNETAVEIRRLKREYEERDILKKPIQVFLRDQKL